MEQVDLQKAYEDFMDELFGFHYANENKDMSHLEAKRSEYTKALHTVQDKYGLKQGHPQFLEWVFTCVGRSPVIIEDEEGDEEDGTSTKN